MTKAFSQLCEKINLSLYDDTLTIYPHIAPLETNDTALALYLNAVVSDDELQFKYLVACESISKSLFFNQYVHSDDHNHGQYHQDNFSRHKRHCHLQFNQTINKTILDNIIDILQTYNLITSNEAALFMKAYDEANELNDSVKNDKSFETIKKGFFLSESKTPTPEAKQNTSSDKKSSTGLKKGFFLSESKTLTPEAKQNTSNDKKSSTGLKKGFFLSKSTPSESTQCKASI